LTLFKKICKKYDMKDEMMQARVERRKLVKNLAVALEDNEY